jgi:hypothetical protein
MTDEEPRPPRLWRQPALFSRESRPLADGGVDWFTVALPDKYACADCGFEGSLLQLQAHLGLMPRGACYDSG